MADLKASVILQPGDPIFGRLTIEKKTAADDIQKGDFLKLTSGKLEKMAAAADDATFVGVSAMQSADADGPSMLLVYIRCIVECPMESASYLVAAELKYNTNGTLEASGGANGIAHAWETKASTTSLKVMVDVVNLQKLFAITA